MSLKDLLERLRYLYVLEKGFQIHDKVRIKGRRKVWTIYAGCKTYGVSEKLFTYYIEDSEGDFKEVFGKDLQKVVDTSCKKCGGNCKKCR